MAPFVSSGIADLIAPLTAGGPVSVVIRVQPTDLERASRWIEATKGTVDDRLEHGLIAATCSPATVAALTETDFLEAIELAAEDLELLETIQDEEEDRPQFEGQIIFKGNY
ncbi:MAG: hypothetical protein U5K37_08510 [Natrialbaceae archaeon]|nr:hypothetical protein [Natrialbaceae archaeon]